MRVSRRESVTFPIVLRELTVLRVVDITPGMRRVTLGGPQLGAFRLRDMELPALRSEGFDDHVKVFVPEPGQDVPVLPRQNPGNLDWPSRERTIAKDYTPRRYDPETGELDLDFARHEKGHASDWAQQLKPGDRAWIAGPKSSAGPPKDVDWLLIAGDDTALPAIGRWLEEMPAGLRAQVFVEVDSVEQEQELASAADVQLTWLHRDGAEPGTTDLLERAVRAAPWWPGTPFAWLAGEALSLKPLRTYLRRERALAPEFVEISGYWRRREVPVVAPLPVVAEAVEDEEDDAYDRLERMADLVGPYALRVAVTLGLPGLVESGVKTVADLAARTGADPANLAALVRYLIRTDVLAGEDGALSLGELGDELVEDDAEHWDLRGPQARLELTVQHLEQTVRGGGPKLAVDENWTVGDRLLAEEDAAWPAPAIAHLHDWTRHPRILAVGPGSVQAAVTVLREHPQVRASVTGSAAELEALSPLMPAALGERIGRIPLGPLAPLPSGYDAYLCMGLITRLEDEVAVSTLRALAATLQRGGTGLIVEHVQPQEWDEEDAAEELLRRCAFGVGLRSGKDLTGLVERSGLRVVSVQEIGWNSHLVEVRAPQ